jgi:hypothetical protein
VPVRWRTAEKSVDNGEYRRPAGLLLPVIFILGATSHIGVLSKNEAIGIIHECAVLYIKNLSGKNVLFYDE